MTDAFAAGPTVARPAGAPHAFRRIHVDLTLHGRDGSFGTTLMPVLFRNGVRHWCGQRVHSGFGRTGLKGERPAAHDLGHRMDRGISDMLRRLEPERRRPAPPV